VNKSPKLQVKIQVQKSKNTYILLYINLLQTYFRNQRTDSNS